MRRHGDGSLGIAELDLHAVCAFGSSRFAVGGNLSQYQLQPPQGILLQRGAPERQVTN